MESNKSIRLLVLDGVIPITYRGVTYQIPVSIECHPRYPNDAPVPYVRPTPAMVLRERHSTVDKEGRVYLLYLSGWDPSKCNMYGVVIAMIRIFSVEPPVNSRSNSTTQSADEPERRNLIAALSKRISGHLQDVNEEAIEEICRLFAKKDDAINTDIYANEHTQQRDKAYKLATEKLKSTLALKDELQQWNTSVADVKQDAHVDDMLHHCNILDHQILECVAQDYAYADSLDQIDEAFVKGLIDHDAYMKHIRHISREQFYPRALRNKIEMVRAKQRASETDSTSKKVKANVSLPFLYAS